jgi:hypothetical protein
MMSNGHCTIEAFEAYLADSLSEFEARSVASHLSECETCRNRAVAISEGLLWTESWVTQTRQQTELQSRLADALKREEARESSAKQKERLHWWRHHLTLGVPSSGRLAARPRYALQARAGVRTRGASPIAPKAQPKWLEATGTPPRIFVPADADVTIALPQGLGQAAMTVLIPIAETGETRIAEAVRSSPSGTQWLAHFRAVPKGEYVVAAEPRRTDYAAEPRRPKS